LAGQTIDAKLESIYEGLGDIQKLVIERTENENEQRIVQRRVHLIHHVIPLNQGIPP